MPRYDYRCEKCGTFEFWQSIKEEPLAVCPTCGSKVERLFSANVGFVLKGAGFYQNDYKNAGGSKKSQTEEKEESANEESGCGRCGSPNPCPADSDED